MIGFSNLNKLYAKFSSFKNEKVRMISENKNGDFHDLKLLKLHFGCCRRYVHMLSLFEWENYDQCALIFQVSVHDLPIVMIRGCVAGRAVACPEGPPLLDWI